MEETATPPRGKNVAYVFGRLCPTTCMQAAGAPFIDSCTAQDEKGNTYKGVAILLKPWQRDKWKQSLVQRALVVAWGKVRP